MNELNDNQYDDIINLPRPISKKHPQMPLEKRAAIFSPFAALTGFEDAIYETSRVTERKRELTNEEKISIDQKLNIILDEKSDTSEATITYFIPDSRKSGGSYNKISGVIKRYDEYNRMIVFTDNSTVPLDSVYDIECDALNKYNFE